MTLRITREKRESQLRATLRLEGYLVAEWAGLLEQECSALLAISAAVILDLSDVRLIDRHGIEALERLDKAGVRLFCPPGAVAAVLEGEGIRIMRDADGVDATH